jgi:uncharacterized protein YlzI (FlbEa/FlbD family)
VENDNRNNIVLSTCLDKEIKVGLKAIQKDKGEPSGYLLGKLLEKRVLYPQESIISTIKESPSLTLAITINGDAKYMVKEHIFDVTEKSKTPRLSIIFYR